MEISILIPVHNAVATVTPLAKGIATHLADRDWELLFVDDASTDGTSEQLVTLADALPRVRAYRLAEMQGKALALRTALYEAHGEIIVTMAGNLRDDPADIPALLNKLDHGFDLVCGWRGGRYIPWYVNSPVGRARSSVRWRFRMKLHDANTTFVAMRADVARAMPYAGMLHRWHTVFANDLGYKVTEVTLRPISEVDDNDRPAQGLWEPEIVQRLLTRRPWWCSNRPSRAVIPWAAAIAFLIAIAFYFMPAGRAFVFTPLLISWLIFMMREYWQASEAQALKAELEHPSSDLDARVVETAGN